MNQVPVAIDTAFFIAGPRIDHIPVSQHGPAFIGNIKKIPVAFLALLVPEGGVGNGTLFLMIILPAHEVNNDVFYAMGRLGIEKIEGIVGSRKMTVHTVGDESLLIIDMSGGLPCLVGKLNFMAGCTKLRGGCPHHGKIGNAEERKGDNDTDDDINSGFEDSFPCRPFTAGDPAHCFHTASRHR